MMGEAAPPAIDVLLEHRTLVQGLARSLLRDRAEDIEQDVWVAALERGPNRPGTGRTWLSRVVRNRVVSAHRKDASRRRYETRPVAVRQAPDPAEILAREETRKHVVEALLSLDALYRDPLVLRYYEELKPREIAERLGVPVETVRTRIKRGHAKLRTALDEEYGDRRAWSAALLPLAWPRGRTGLSTAAATAIAVALVAGVAGLLLFAFREAPGDPEADTELVADTPPDPAAPTLTTTPQRPSDPNPWVWEGRVLRQTWRPNPPAVPGARVLIHRHEGGVRRERVGSAVADAEGRVRISLGALKRLSRPRRAASTLIASVEGWQSSAQGAILGVEVDPDRPWKLPRSVYVWKAPVFGRILGDDGLPRYGTLALFHGPPEEPTVVHRTWSVHNGVFPTVPAKAVPAAASGRPLSLMAWVPGEGSARVDGIRLHPDHAVDLGDVVLSLPDDAFRVTVVHTDGRPVPGVPVVGELACPTAKKSVYEGPLGSMRATGIPSVTVTRTTDASGVARFWLPPDAVLRLRLPRPRAVGAEDVPPAPSYRSKDGSVRLEVAEHLLELEVVDTAGVGLAARNWSAYGWWPRRRNAFGAARLAIERGRRWESDWIIERPTGTPEHTHRIRLLAEPGSHWYVGVHNDLLERGQAFVEVDAEKLVTRGRIVVRGDEALGSWRVRPAPHVPDPFRWLLTARRGGSISGTGKPGHAFPGIPAGDYEMEIRPFMTTTAPPWKVAVKIRGRQTTDVVLEPPDLGYLFFAATVKPELQPGLDRGVVTAVSLRVPPETRARHLAWKLDEKRRVGIAMSGRFAPAHLHRIGLFKLDLPTGRWRVRYDGAAWQSEPVEIDIEGGRATTAKFVLGPKAQKPAKR